MTDIIKNDKLWPGILEEAVVTILLKLPEEDKNAARKMSKFDFVTSCHLSLGMYIRNQFGLWQGNEKLKIALGASSPDDASRIILSAIWETLRKEVDVAGERK